MQQYQQARPRKASRIYRWSWLLPLVSIGLLSFLPPLMIAAKLGQKRTWQLAGGIAAAWLLGFALVGTGPDDVDTFWNTLGMLIYLGAAIGSVIYVLAMAPKIVRAGPPPAPAYDPNPAAIQEIQADRQKRAEARKMAQRDPQMARELRIGRPDLPRQYDDGGLVDVNSVSEATMTQLLGLSSATSTHVVEVRQQLGRFEHADDLVNLAGVELSAYDQVKDRIIVL